MAKKNITFRIDETLIAKLNELRGSMSQNAFLEELITGNAPQVQLQANTDSQVQVQLQAQTEALEKLQVQVQLLVNQQSQVQVQVIAKEEPKPTKKKDRKLAPNERIIVDEDGIETLEIDETPEWQRKELSPQDFYGKLPKPYEKGEFDHDPQRYLDALDAEAEPKPKKYVEKEKPFNPFL